MSKTETLIKTEKLNKIFSNGKLETPVLFDIDLEIADGEFVAIMGPSGCGKSTLMHILGTMLSATSGKVIIDGVDIATLNDSARARLRRDKIGFVFQRFNLFKTLNAYQNIAVAEHIRGHELDGQITRALEAVQMSDKARFKPGQLSIGQQQRVAIARAISHRPKILMADEPTGNLDSGNAKLIMELFQEVHKSYGVTIVMITHSQTASEWADRVISMNDGRI